MADQNTQFYAILTNVGAAKQANADALGVPWKITQLGVGDANGTEPTPNATQTRLINEWRRAPLNQLKVDEKNSAIIVAEQVIPAEVGGKWIREIALYDADDDMIAVANCPPTFKPLLNQGSGRTQVVRMNLLVSSSSNVELKIDPAVVLATREYVDVAIISALNKQDFKHSVRAATTAPIVLSGLQTIDGVALGSGARVLVKDQGAGKDKDNGVYLVAADAWTRATDADTSEEVTPGLFVQVEQGTANGDSVWQLVTDAPITLGTTALVFEMVAGRTGVSAGSYTKVTVDKYGRVIGGTNPTTLAAMGILDTYTQEQVDAKVQELSLARATVGESRNARMNVPEPASVVTWKADELIVKSALGKLAWILANVEVTLNVATLGANGMNAGTVPLNGYVGIYVIYNPATGARAALAIDATSTVVPQVYAGPTPPGYTASALVAVVPTDGLGRISPVLVNGRDIVPGPTMPYIGSAVVSMAPISLAGSVPLNAVSAAGLFSVKGDQAGSLVIELYSSPGGLGIKRNTSAVSTGGVSSIVFENFTLAIRQLMYITTINMTSGTPEFVVYITGYRI